MPGLEDFQKKIPSMGSLQELGSRVKSLAIPTDPKEKYQSYLKSLALQDLRDLEAKGKFS